GFARPKLRSWLAFTAALSFLLISFAAAISVVEWRKQLATTDGELQSAAEMGGRAVDSYFDSLKGSLTALRESLPDLRDDAASVEVKEVVHRALNVFHAAHPELRNVIIAGEDGQVWVASTRWGEGPMPSIRDNDSFKAYRSGAPVEFDIGRPTWPRTANGWV